jgi:hypothetical protein
MHYILLVERKPGMLLNGAPSKTMSISSAAAPLGGGGSVRGPVLGEATLVAVELALQSGRVGAEHMLKSNSDR